MINLTYSEINNQTIWYCLYNYPLNLSFYYSYSSSQLYAWVEFESDNSIIYWVKFPYGLSATSSVNVTIKFTHKNQYPYTGISPLVAEQLNISPTLYDNGNNTFNYYQSFAGLTSLPTNWTTIYKASTSSLVFNKYNTTIEDININNGITQTGNGYSAGLNNQVFDIAASVPTTTANTNGVIVLGAGNATSTNEYFIDTNGNLTIGNGNAGVAFGYPNSGNSGVFDLYVGSTNAGTTNYNSNLTIYSIGMYDGVATFYQNYKEILNYNGSPSTYNLPITIGLQSNSGGYLYLYFVDIRYYPPNGVMPEITNVYVK